MGVKDRITAVEKSAQCLHRSAAGCRTSRPSAVLAGIEKGARELDI